MKSKKTVWILLAAIVILGAFLRSYEFHDWLRFSVDQPRDARIIDNAISGKEKLPLLGPKANGTEFHLGPAYYQLSYLSGRIFGAEPDKYAYPTLFCGILALPLMFVFLRERFSARISLLVTLAMSVSYFMILTSRFSSNPNLIPFFLLIHFLALLGIMNGTGRRPVLWAAVIGASLGILVQLHTTVLVILPVLDLAVFAFLIAKKKMPHPWKTFLIALLIALAFNASQIRYEFEHDFDNTKSFFAGLHSNSGNGKAKGAMLIAACQMQANLTIASSAISSFQTDDDSKNANCDEIFVNPGFGTFGKDAYWMVIGAGIAFFIAGYGLLIAKWKKETDPRKRNFLGLVGAYNAIAFVFLVPVSEVMQTGYFIILFLVPFVLLGLVLESLGGWKRRRVGSAVAAIVMILLVAASVRKDCLAYLAYASGEENNTRSSTLGEIERMSDYVLASAGDRKRLYFSGDKDFYVRYFKAVDYLVEKEAGMRMDLLDYRLDRIYGSKEKTAPESGIPIFYVDNNSSKDPGIGDEIKGHRITDFRRFESQTIYELGN